MNEIKPEYLKEYKTRDGRKAVYLGFDGDHYVYSIDFNNWYFTTQLFYTGVKNQVSLDIVDEWKEPRVKEVDLYMQIRPEDAGAIVSTIDCLDCETIATKRITIKEGEFIDESN